MTETTPSQDRHQPAATDEATTPPTPDQSAGTTRSRLPGWLQPDSSSPDEATAGGEASDAGSPVRSELPPEPRSKRTGASRGSSRAEKRNLREAIKAGVLGATSAAHSFLVRDELHQALGLLLADEDDANAIAEPAAELVGRRMKDAPVSDDVSDGIALGMAVFVYVMKQLRRLSDGRQLRDEGAVVGGLQRDDTHQQSEEPAA